MLNTASRTWLVGGVWLATLALVIAGSVAMGARTSTTALLLALSVSAGGHHVADRAWCAIADGGRGALHGRQVVDRSGIVDTDNRSFGSCRVLCRLWA